MARRSLTTTSYAILGLLYLRPWSGYELARQMSRSLGYIWPRASSAIYEEPRNLVAHGFVSSSGETTGRRPKTVYSITEPGREALREWLALESASPQFESEAMVRISFPEAAARRVLLDNIQRLGEQGRTIRDRVVSQAHDYLAPGHGPFPDRLHVIALDARFVFDYADFLSRWASWAEDQVSGWPARRPAPVRDSLQVLRSVVIGADGPVQVREMRRGEEALVAGITLHAYAEFSSRLSARTWSRYQADLLDVGSRAAAGTILVAEIDGSVAGAVSYMRTPTAIPRLPPDFALLRTLAVIPSMRQGGVGEALTTACVERARAEGARGIGLQTAGVMVAARNLYQRMGFRQAGSTLHPVGVTLHLMLREL